MTGELASGLASMLWSGWSALGRMLLIGILTYAAAVFLLRGAGQQALTKLTAYGFLVTIALGSVLATALMSEQVKLDKAILAFGLLLLLQRILAWLSNKFRWVRRLVNNEPALILRDGQYLPEAMQRTNVTREEIDGAIRSAGQGGHDKIAAVVLETDGSFSVIPQMNFADGSALTSMEQGRGQTATRGQPRPI